MNFARPDVSDGFEELLQYFLWFQLVYAIWQIIRTAKFSRLPYVMVSSLWYGLDSCFKTRKVIIVKESVALDPTVSAPALPPGMTVKDIDGVNFKVSFDPQKPYIYVTDFQRASHMTMLRIYHLKKIQFGMDDDLLWPNGHLIRRLEFIHAMDHVSRGKGYVVEPSIKCFFDYSSTEVLNQNFLQLASIWPLILQARNYNFWSGVLSICIILIDLLSYPANKLWRWIQYWISRLVKGIISMFSLRESRLFLHTFMATISTRFQCWNFVAEKASVKLLKEFPLSSNIKLKKHEIGGISPIDCSYGPWKRQTFLEQSGVTFDVLSNPGYFYGNDSVKITPSKNVMFKEMGWTIEDMAYFLGVCTLCDTVKFSPVKFLEPSNAQCCDLSEVVKGVKNRKFLLCELKTEKRVFIT